jgi:hypothetical protein
MSKNQRSKNQSTPEVTEKVLGGETTTPAANETAETEEKAPEKFVSILDPNLGETPPADQIEVEVEEEEIDDELYTLKDNHLFVPGIGTLVKNPADPKPLSDEHLKKLFEYASSQGVSREIVIKKHLQRIRLVEVKDFQPVQPTKLEKYVVDKE